MVLVRRLAAARRTREIGVRKALGATAADVLVGLYREVGGLALIANLVAWPVACWLADAWLARFAYRVALGPTAFAAAAAVVGSVATASVGYQALRAAPANPVDALRQE
ncbi:MAG: ABC transporter permease [Candidatus Latescibacterota bacterium]